MFLLSSVANQSRTASLLAGCLSRALIGLRLFAGNNSLKAAVLSFWSRGLPQFVGRQVPACRLPPPVAAVLRDFALCSRLPLSRCRSANAFGESSVIVALSEEGKHKTARVFALAKRKSRALLSSNFRHFYFLFFFFSLHSSVLLLILFACQLRLSRLANKAAFLLSKIVAKKQENKALKPTLCARQATTKRKQAKQRTKQERFY